LRTRVERLPFLGPEIEKGRLPNFRFVYRTVKSDQMMSFYRSEPSKSHRIRSRTWRDHEWGRGSKVDIMVLLNSIRARMGRQCSYALMAWCDIRQCRTEDSVVASMEEHWRGLLQ